MVSAVAVTFTMALLSHQTGLGFMMEEQCTDNFVQIITNIAVFIETK